MEKASDPNNVEQVGLSASATEKYKMHVHIWAMKIAPILARSMAILRMKNDTPP